jgi:hypothetical protein
MGELIEQSDTQSFLLFRPVEFQPGDAFVFVDVIDDEFVVGHVFSLLRFVQIVQTVPIVQAVQYGHAVKSNM